MKRMLLFIVLLPLASGSVYSSEPGQPLRGEDFVLLSPGLTAESVFPPYGCPTEPHSWCWSTEDGPVFDPTGNQYGLRVDTIPLTCAPPGEAYKWTVIRLTPSGTSEDVAYIQTRCIQPQCVFRTNAITDFG